jgi:hypothetical protein
VIGRFLVHLTTVFQLYKLHNIVRDGNIILSDEYFVERGGHGTCDCHPGIRLKNETTKNVGELSDIRAEFKFGALPLYQLLGPTLFLAMTYTLVLIPEH